MSKDSSHGQIGRRDLLRMGAAAAAAAALGPLPLPHVAARAAGAQRGGVGVKKPNIIFAFSDEHRWCSMPFTEMPEVVAPNMGRMTREGTRFQNCISTSPICIPFRGMLMTGMWPHRSTIISNDYFSNADAIGVDAPTIAHTFGAAGYVTGYVGKWHLKRDTVYNAGFDYFKHWLYGDKHWETEHRDVPSHGDWEVSTNYNAIGMTDQALDFIRQNAHGDRPFLMMLSWNPPHWRWDDAPEEFVKLYPQDEIPFRPNVTENRYKQGTQLLHYQHYHAHISAVDRQLGRLTDALEELGIAGDTVLIYSADHGSSFGSNGVSNKANPYDESIRVPFLVRWPGRVPAGRRTDVPVGTIDLYPTLCGLAGIAAPEHCGGRDFSAVIVGGEAVGFESQLILVNNFRRNYYRTLLYPDGRNYLYPFRGVRTRRYTYVVYAEGEWLLFDNQEDPYQMNNLVNDPAHAHVKAMLRRELDSWLAKAEDPFIPQEWRDLPLPERIARENEYYALNRAKAQWDRYKEGVLAAYAKRELTPEQDTKLRAACDRVFDATFFGMYKALEYEMSPARKPSSARLEELKATLRQHEQAHLARFNGEAEKIVGQRP